MGKKICRLCYKKIIDANSEDVWEKLVFEESYKEFLMQSQLYNTEKKFNSFSEMILNTPTAERLHFLVSTSVIGYLKQLNGIIPDILNSLGKRFISFNNFRFEIINSNIKDKTKHQVAINFYSDALLWHDTIGSQMVLSKDEKNDVGEYLTDLVSMQPFFSIYSLKEIE